MDDFLAYWGFVAWIQVKSARVTMHRGFDRARIEPWTAGLARIIPRAIAAAAFGAMRRLRRFAAQLRPGDGALRPPALADARAARRRRSATSPTDHFETHFERLRAYAAFTPAANAAGAPAISLPLAVSASGLPIGVHFSARRDDDRTLLRAGADALPGGHLLRRGSCRAGRGRRRCRRGCSGARRTCCGSFAGHWVREVGQHTTAASSGWRLRSSRHCAS
jgi:Asp-tRNA(Asn)/Glu-tRNA(Gln) amidotransferase A subunit family amidase